MDDICLGAQSGTVAITDLPATVTDEVGPLLELRHTHPSFLPMSPENAWLASKRYTQLLDQLGREVWYDEPSGNLGYIAVPTLQDDPLAWTNFVLRAKRAAMDAGFSDDHAAKLTAAIGEFYANVIDHSTNAATGYVVYAASHGRFEFCVADSGIGVLASLRSNPAFIQLSDAGSALELALSEGVSRHYEEDGHGYGFRPLFIDLANISRYMRFRSADYGRDITRNADGSIDARTSQLAFIPGFFCHVRCDLD